MSLFLKKHPSLAWVALVVVCTGVSLAVAWAQRSQSAPAPAPLAAAPAVAARHPVVIRPTNATPRMDLGIKSAGGESVNAACSTCHSTTTPNVSRTSVEDLGPPHAGLKFQHGSLSCLSCHNASDYDTLRLADSRSIPFSDVMTLCAQCHGTHKRDYDRGSHGGMVGHWDLTKGGRTRNSCVHCHDPHHPEFPLVMPVLPPRDRISVPKTNH